MVFQASKGQIQSLLISVYHVNDVLYGREGFQWALTGESRGWKAYLFSAHSRLGNQSAKGKLRDGWLTMLLHLGWFMITALHPSHMSNVRTHLSCAWAEELDSSSWESSWSSTAFWLIHLTRAWKCSLFQSCDGKVWFAGCNDQCLPFQPHDIS